MKIKARRRIEHKTPGKLIGGAWVARHGTALGDLQSNDVSGT